MVALSYLTILPLHILLKKADVDPLHDPLAGFLLGVYLIAIQALADLLLNGPDPMHLY